MRTSVSNRFVDFSTKFEGRVAWMYADVKGLITVGIGNLVDPRAAALTLPFVDKTNGERVSVVAIGAEWDTLKARREELGRKGHRACEAITELRLTDAAIDELVLGKVRSNESVLRSSFPDFDQFPADAQLGLHSMAWALGPAFATGWPNFRAAVLALDFDAAAEHCRMSEAGNPGVIPRNDANQQLFRNAAAVLARGADPDVLYYPGAVVVVSDQDVVPDEAVVPTEEVVLEDDVEGVSEEAVVPEDDVEGVSEEEVVPEDDVEGVSEEEVAPEDDVQDVSEGEVAPEDDVDEVSGEEPTDEADLVAIGGAR